jgi:hypothetical protein
MRATHRVKWLPLDAFRALMSAGSGFRHGHWCVFVDVQLVEPGFHIIVTNAEPGIDLSVRFGDKGHFPPDSRFALFGGFERLRGLGGRRDEFDCHESNITKLAMIFHMNPLSAGHSSRKT